MRTVNSIITGFFIAASFFITTEISGQKTAATPTVNGNPEYKNALGLRAGRTAGITYKHFFNTGNAFEAILGLWPNAFGLTGLYQKHAATGLDGLKFYYGGGGHFTRETGRYYYRHYGLRGDEYNYRYGKNGLAVGIDGIVGIDWKIGVIPLALSLDLKPFLEVSNYGIIYTAIDAGLGIKVAF
jgi:hypothetical protein